jgi:Amiloride-sensitive sodium channel
LGLFLGVSVISFIELFYFCTIRLFFNLMSENEVILEETHSLKNNHGGSNWLALARKFIEDYFSNTTIQGFKYMTDNKRSLFERLWWLIVFVISIFCCGSLILEVFERYDRAPIIVSFAEKETPIQDVSYLK